MNRSPTTFQSIQNDIESFQPLIYNDNLIKDDGRLFPEYQLYCEGMHRPALRGMLHLLLAILSPIGMYHLFIEAHGFQTGQLAGLIYMLSNFWCCGISGLFHVGKWSPKTEILLQKLDHCGIAILSAGTNLPVCFLLLPFNYGATLAILSCVSCAWACWNILNRRPGVWRLVLVATAILPFFPILFYYMSTFEFQCMVANTLFMAVGTVIFTHQRPDPCRSVIGYHEIFHVFTGLGFISIYLCNWSVIRRTCNPYAHITDVSELLAIMAHELQMQKID